MKFLPYIFAFSVLLSQAIYGQELPRPSMITHDDTAALPKQYNMKLGPVLFDFSSSVNGEYNDNIGLSEKGAKSDFTVTPEIGVGIQWPVTQTNTLTLNTSLGYTHYFIHSEFDTSHVLVSPGSRLSFNVYSGNFKINFHDGFAYEQDPVSEGALSNVVTFDRFTNDAGVSVLWDLNKLILNFNYDHINFIATGLQDNNGNQLPDPGALNYSADQVSFSAEAHPSSTFVVGVESAASLRTYDDFSGNYTALSAGPFFRVQITQNLKAEASGGYQELDSPDNTLPGGQIAPAGVFGPSGGAGSNNGYYANLTLDHQLNKYYVQRLTVSHEMDLGYLAEQSVTTAFSYTSSWRVHSHLNLAFTLSYQLVDEQGGLVGLSAYNQFLGAVQANFPIAKNFTGSLLYQFTDKDADIANQGYVQNKVDATVTYHF